MVYYLIDPNVITLYQKKNFEVLPISPKLDFRDKLTKSLTKSRDFVILQLFNPIWRGGGDMMTPKVLLTTEVKRLRGESWNFATFNTNLWSIKS